MNYITHLNTFFSLIRTDERLTSTNVCLYFALFHYWNFNRFQNPFTIYREDILELSKLSKNTYYKCMKQLHDAQYIYYHPSPGKFREVRISIIRLEKEKEKRTGFKQLDLFSQNDDTSCPKIETDTVSKLRPVSPKIETGTVANLRHLYKPNKIKQNSVSNTPTKIFEKNKEINDKLNKLHEASPPFVNGDVPLGRIGNSDGLGQFPFNKEDDRRPGDLKEVEDIFIQNRSSIAEAHKFFYYNQAKNWMLTEKLPVKDWRALAQKWILNTKPKPQPQPQPQSQPMHEAIQQLYELYLKGEKINKYILPEFADYLQLEITEAIKQEAIARRINQLSGSNEASILNLWKAYMQPDHTNELLLKDQPNLTALAKRVAVLKHFQSYGQG